MKKLEAIEGVIVLLSAILLLPIWMASSDMIQLPPTLVKVLGFLQYPILVVLGIIFIRRLRRVIRAFRENRNRPGPF